MALSTNTPRSYEVDDSPLYNDFPVKASTTIYEGAAVGSSSGLARGLVAGDMFLGFADRKADNASGANSAINVHLRQRGGIVLSVTGVTGVANVGAIVYATADGTFTLEGDSNSDHEWDSSIGRIERFISGTTAVVRFEATQVSTKGN